MICEIDFARLKALAIPYKSCGNILLARLYSNAECFADKKLCTVYEVENAGFMCLYNRNLTAFFYKKPNFDEIADFLNFNKSAITCFECDDRYAKKIAKLTGADIIFGDAFLFSKIKRNPNPCQIEKTEDVKGFFETLKNADPVYKDTTYDGYYCDFFYRRPFGARLYLAKKHSVCVATAAVLHIFYNYAVISDVAVKQDFRRQKIGTSLINFVCLDLAEENLLPALLCTNKSAARLYKKAGFTKIHRFALLCFKEGV